MISVATVLTACGIETETLSMGLAYNGRVLQQCLPLAVLKRLINQFNKDFLHELQQCLPLAVLKP